VPAPAFVKQLATIGDLLDIIPAPRTSLPLALFTVSMASRDGYRTGRGKVVMRAKCHFEDRQRPAPVIHHR
jgi:DNA gyrase subunit A